MEPLLILIVIPTLAFIMLRLDSVRTNGLDAQSRDRSRRWMPVVSIACCVVSAIFVWTFIGTFLSIEPWRYRQAIIAIARLSVALGMLSLGLAAFRLSRHIARDELSMKEIVRRDLETSRARTVAILLALLPLALPALLVTTTVGFLPLLYFSFSSTSRRFIQNQLLWTLALAIRNDMEPGAEVHGLANSLDRDRYSPAKIILFVFMGLIGMCVLTVIAVFVPFLLIPIGMVGSLLIVVLVVRIRQRQILLSELNTLAANLYDGVPLSTALSYSPRLLPPEIVGAIEAAIDAGGNVGDVLGGIAVDHSQVLERRILTGGMIDNGAIYAVFLITVLVHIVAFIMYFIIPKYKAIFGDFGVELPPVTLIWIQVADVFVEYWYLLAPFLFVPLLPFVAASVLMLEDISWVPKVFLRLFPRLETPMLLRRLGYVAANRFALQPSLLTLANSIPDYHRSRRYERLESRLEAGETLGHVLQHEQFVNSREAHSIDHAARMGHLGWALTALANTIQQRRISRSRWVMEFVRPFVILLLAFFVGSFCVAMFLPLVQLIIGLG